MSEVGTQTDIDSTPNNKAISESQLLHEDEVDGYDAEEETDTGSLLSFTPDSTSDFVYLDAETSDEDGQGSEEDDEEWAVVSPRLCRHTPNSVPPPMLADDNLSPSL